MRQPDCEEKRDPDLAKSRIKDENMELDPNARLEKQTLEIQPLQPINRQQRSERCRLISQKKNGPRVTREY